MKRYNITVTTDGHRPLFVESETGAWVRYKETINRTCGDCEWWDVAEEFCKHTQDEVRYCGPDFGCIHQQAKGV